MPGEPRDLLREEEEANRKAIDRIEGEEGKNRNISMNEKGKEKEKKRPLLLKKHESKGNEISLFLMSLFLMYLFLVTLSIMYLF